jgi:hypothetical protein
MSMNEQPEALRKQSLLALNLPRSAEHMHKTIEIAPLQHSCYSLISYLVTIAFMHLLGCETKLSLFN